MVNVGKYTTPMDPMGVDLFFYKMGPEPIVIKWGDKEPL